MISSSITELCLNAGGVAVAAGLAYGGFCYASLWPGSRLFGRALIAPRNPDEFALTFDDGPNPIWTPRLLDALAAHGVPASFFMVGQRAVEQKDLVRRVVAEGHLIGLHSWTHPSLARCSAARIREELTRSKDAIEQITGQPVRFLRPPFGARRPAVFSVARSLGLTTVLWNAMTSDWSERSVDKIVARQCAKIDRLARQGWAANVVLHDGGHLDPRIDRGPSVAAADRLVAHYKSTRRFVALDAWL
jgi:peptidoglycan-N-acetylglucosamine deacetylase